MNLAISLASPVSSFIQETLLSISSKIRFRLWTMHGVPKMWSYLPSIIKPVALQTGALSVITCPTLLGPICSIAFIITSAMNYASFTSSEQSSALINIAPLGEVAMIFINGLRLISVHPSETMVNRYSKKNELELKYPPQAPSHF